MKKIENNFAVTGFVGKDAERVRPNRSSAGKGNSSNSNCTFFILYSYCKIILLQR